MKDIADIRKTDDRAEPLSQLEMNLYRKYTGKIAWLANSTRPDLCYLALQISKKNQGATISDLRDINHIIKKVREKKSLVKYEHLGDVDDLVIIGVGDASY